MNLRKHVRCFFKLICKPRIREFLNMDPCNAIVDKYLLIGVFIYFIRAHFEAKDYTTRNFYIALYLCHEIHEEVDFFKYRIMKNCLGDCIENLQCVQRFNSDRIQLLKKINFHVQFRKEHCELIFSRFPHAMWKRNRTKEHSGVIIDENTACHTCSLPFNPC
ncbi:speedy protein 1-A isoform X2 [Coccinella septempunctata]|uniref:speedy protein 1-A isoform X2 n=1 Tax=Coccinella septempunctata TaxID=41139 RepID=UPI001D066364|nr:speedy protein 1-A isoform X2 [Coccinella septempunctata]